MARFDLTVAELRARPGVKWHRHADDVLPAWIAEMDFDVPPPVHRVLRRITEQGVYGYEDPSLYPSVAAVFASYMRRRFAWPANPKLVLPVADLVQALFTCVHAFSDRGQRVILQSPIYPPFINAVRENGREVLENPLADDGERFCL